VTWLIELVQKYNGGTPRYRGDEVVGGLTVTVGRATTYSTEAGAQAVIEKLETHPWGRWEARERLPERQPVDESLTGEEA
jgi:hypothetical protein